MRKRILLPYLCLVSIALGVFLILSLPSGDHFIEVGLNITIKTNESWNGFTYKGFDALGYGVLEYLDSTPIHVGNGDLITIEDRVTYKILIHEALFCVIIEVEEDP